MLRLLNTGMGYMGLSRKQPQSGEISLIDSRIADVVNNELKNNLSLREAALLAGTCKSFSSFRDSALKAEMLMNELEDKQVFWSDIGKCREVLGFECDTFLPRVLSKVLNGRLGTSYGKDLLKLLRENSSDKITALNLIDQEISIPGLREITRSCSNLDFLTLYFNGDELQEIDPEWLQRFADANPRLQQIKLIRNAGPNYREQRIYSPLIPK